MIVALYESLMNVVKLVHVQMHVPKEISILFTGHLTITKMRRNHHDYVDN